MIKADQFRPSNFPAACTACSTGSGHRGRTGEAGDSGCGMVAALDSAWDSRSHVVWPAGCAGLVRRRPAVRSGPRVLGANIGGGSGVTGVTSTGYGVFGFSSTGNAVFGLLTLAAGRSSAKNTGIALTPTSLVLATIQGNVAGV